MTSIEEDQMEESGRLSRRLPQIGWGIVLSLLFISGLTLALIVNPIFSLIIKSQVLLRPMSMSEALWADYPVPLKTSIYIFNVTNPVEVLEKGSKPNLTEIGPFVYDEYHLKKNVKWNPDNGTVTYENLREYHSNPSETKASLDQLVTMINPPAATVGSIAEKQSSVVRGMINGALMLAKEKLFVSHPARQVIFDGYKDPILWVVEELKKLNIAIPGATDRFAIYYRRNMTAWFDGIFNMYTGSLDVAKANQMYSWNYSTHTKFFPGKCGEVWGSGDLFQPYLDQFHDVALFSNDLCRPIVLTRDGDRRVKGVLGNRYVVDDKYFANSSVNQDNSCFEGGEELPSGIFNISTCQFNAPAFISQPHFYQADPFFSQLISDGSMRPDKDKHESAFVIEPQTGIPLQVIARFQVNFRISPIKELDLFKNLKGPVFFPAFWFETRMDLADSMKGEMWFLSCLTNIFRVVAFTMLGIAVGAPCVWFIYHHAKHGLGLRAPVGRRRGTLEESGNSAFGEGDGDRLMKDGDDEKP